MHFSETVVTADSIYYRIHFTETTSNAVTMHQIENIQQ